MHFACARVSGICLFLPDEGSSREGMSGVTFDTPGVCEHNLGANVTSQMPSAISLAIVLGPVHEAQVRQ